MPKTTQPENSQTGGPEQQSHESILVEILQIALTPGALTDKFLQILDYLIAIGPLEFLPRAAIFLADQDEQKLTLKASRGFSESHRLCAAIGFGQCHCGASAQLEISRFFRNKPPFLNEDTSASEPYSGNYCIPISKDGILYGLFTLYVTAGHKSSQSIRQLLNAVANVLAVIIDSQKMDQQMIQLVNDLRGSIINLREEKKFSESIIQGLNHGLLVVDLDGRIRKSNGVARKILHPFTRYLEGQYLADFLPRDAEEKLLAVQRDSKNLPERELSLQTDSGDRKIISYSNVPREDTQGRQVGVIISISDISELKFIRKEMEKMNRLSTVAEIASAVAHEVRNPLAGIKIMAQSIEEDARHNSDQLECAQRIIRQVDRLNDLLNDFFSYARPAEPNKQPTSLAFILDETKPLIHNRLMKNHIRLTTRIRPDLPLIMADARQVQQVFLNLFLNAIDAILEQGTIHITADLLSSNQLNFYQKKYPGILDDCGYVMVHFTDNGKGMSSEIAELVFEPFFTTKSSGNGLGLSIVYRTLKENDAAIVLSSKEGKGTTFTIFFRAAY